MPLSSPVARHAPAGRLVALGLVAALSPRAAVAQPVVLTAAYAYQLQDFDPTGYLVSQFRNPIAGCVDFLTGSGPQSVNVPCLVDNGGWNGTAGIAAPGSETASTSAYAAFDPATGSFKTAASVSANGFTLSRFIPSVDQNGQRIYTNEQRPDLLGAWSQIGLVDQFILTGSPGLTPSTLHLSLDWSGRMHTPGPMGLLNAFAYNHLQFCAGPLGTCQDGNTANDDQILYGFADVNADGQTTGAPLSFSAYVGLNGGVGQSLTFTGTSSAVADPSGNGTLTTIDGTFDIQNLPVAMFQAFDFDLYSWNWAEFRHQAANNPDCDPTDPTFGGCLDTTWPPESAFGFVDSDFSHTIRLASYQVFDANGRDITNGVGIGFGSGLVVPPNASSPPVTATPEPVTLALVGGGLLALGLGARRRVV